MLHSKPGEKTPPKSAKNTQRESTDDVKLYLSPGKEGSD